CPIDFGTREVAFARFEPGTDVLVDVGEVDTIQQTLDEWRVYCISRQFGVAGVPTEANNETKDTLALADARAGVLTAALQNVDRWPDSIHATTMANLPT